MEVCEELQKNENVTKDVVEIMCQFVKEREPLEVYDNSYEFAEWVFEKLDLEEALVQQWFNEADVTE